MRTIVELRLDAMARTAGAPAFLGIEVLGQRLAALYHKSLHDAMKRRAIVKTIPGQLLEILDRLRRDIRPEFHNHLARGGFDDGYFVFAHNEFGLVGII